MSATDTRGPFTFASDEGVAAVKQAMREQADPYKIEIPHREHSDFVMLADVLDSNDPDHLLNRVEHGAYLDPREFDWLMDVLVIAFNEGNEDAGGFASSIATTLEVEWI